MKTALMVGLVAVCGAVAAPANAQLAFKPYVELSYGVGGMDVSDARSTGTTLSETTDWAVGFSLGLADVLGPFDIRLDSYSAQIEDPAITSYVAEVDVDAVYLNLLYTQELNDRLEIYAGGGAGKADLSYDGCWLCVPTVLVEGDDSAFSWQAVGGVRYKVWSGLGVFVEARYMSADDFLINETPSTPPDPLLTVDYPTDYRSFVAMGGLRWQF